MGYFGNEVATRALWARGWLDTGDVGYFAEGELFLTGRAKDLVIRAGRNLHPEELEQALGELGGIRRGGVAVFASTDSRLGTERLVVAVETELDDPDERMALRTSIIRRAVDLSGTPPDEVVLVAPGSLLRTASGKIRRAATRDAFEGGVLGRRAAPVVVQLARFALSGLGATARRLRDVVATLSYAAYLWALVALVGIPLLVAMRLPLPLRARWALTRAAGRTLRGMAGIDLRVEGALPVGGAPMVIVSNHPSFVDGLVLLLASAEPVVFVASTDLEHHHLVGSFLRRLGCAFVHRDEPERSEQDVAKLVRLLLEGRRVAVFPEGSITRAPGLRRFHLGAFAIAVAAKCPIVPVGIRGTRNIVRPGTYLPHRAGVEVIIGTPLMATGDDFSAQVELAERTRNAVKHLSREPGTA